MASASPLPAVLEAVSRSIYGEARSCRIDIVRQAGLRADSTAIYLIDGTYILHVSPDTFPNAAAREVAAIRAITPVLKDAAKVLLPIVAEGNVGDISFMAIPRARPIGLTRFVGRIDRIRVRASTLAWVRSLATLVEEPTEAASTAFRRCLKALAEMEGLPPEIARAARDAEIAITDGLPVGHVPMHGDLWAGNLLRTPDGSLRVIDWAGSLPHGYGVFDLLRLGMSLSIPETTMRREIAILTETLGGPEALRAHLLGALGHYAANLGFFPRELMIQSADRAWQALTRFT